MARIKVVMPQMGESITNGTITTWHKKVGDKIELDEILLDISTDKVESEIPAPTEGIIAALHFPEGETIDVGVVIAEIEDDLSAEISAPSPSPSTKQEDDVAINLPEKPQESAPQPQSSSSERRFYTPLVKAMAQEKGVSLEELAHLKGSGAGGRVNKADLEAFLESKQEVSVQNKPAENIITLRQEKPTTSATPSSSGREEIIPMDNLRKTIARNMVLSKQTSPHVNSVSEVDLSHLVRFREGIKKDFEKQEGFKITYTPFIMRAIILALKEFPLVNASVDGDKIIVKKDINLGVAVATPGNGLVVPVVKSADTLNMLGLCRSLNELAHKARNKKLTLDELQGGTFTFSNVGSFGTLFATPIILQPQVGIYASGVIQKRPVVVDDAIAIRHMMYGTHSYDHRIVDGELGGRFLEAIHQNLREMRPESLF